MHQTIIKGIVGKNFVIQKLTLVLILKLRAKDTLYSAKNQLTFEI